MKNNRGAIEMLIDKCFRMGQGGYACGEDRPYFTKEAMRYARELNLLDEDALEDLRWEDYIEYCNSFNLVPSHRLNDVRFLMALNISFAVLNNKVYLIGTYIDTPLEGVSVPYKIAKSRDCYATVKKWNDELSLMPNKVDYKYTIRDTSDTKELFAKKYSLSYEDYKKDHRILHK